MKAEINSTLLKASNETTGDSLAKASAFGSFFNMVNQKKKMRQMQGISDEMYNSIHRKPQLYVPGNPPDSRMRSICIVLDGHCQVINKADTFYFHDLRPGDHFGSSDLLKIIGIEYLGDIYAGPNGVRVMIIPKPD